MKNAISELESAVIDLDLGTSIVKANKCISKESRVVIGGFVVKLSERRFPAAIEGIPTKFVLNV